MIRFTVGKTAVCFDFTFFAAIGIILTFDESGYSLLCLAACFCHEAAHLIMLFAEKKPPDEIIFSGGGICIRQRKDADVFTLCAGIAANFILFFIFYFLFEKNNIFRLCFAVSNLFVGIVNLLPIAQMDGKKLLEKLCLKFLPLSKTEKILFFSEIVSLTLLEICVILFIISGNMNFTALLIILYMAIVQIIQ